MANLTGSDGSVTLPSGFNATLNTWSANVTRVTSDVTGFGGTIRDRRASGVLDITGSAGGVPKRYDGSSSGSDDNFAPMPHSSTTISNFTGGALTLQVAAASGSGDNARLVFDAVFSSVAFSVTNDGDSTVTFNFELNDATPTITWDETA